MSLAFGFRISASYISRIVQQTLAVLRTKLLPIFLPPISPDELKTKAEDFGRQWHFPNCVGAVDGKHVRIVSPGHSGSLYFNYKQFFSIVLLAVVDANYKFVFVDVGSYGKEGDSGIFDKSNIGKTFRTGNMFPPPCKLPSSDIVVPHVFVGDEAFRLHANMMKPFSRPATHANNEKAIFNYRLSRARRVSENAFALLSQVFRLFYTPIAVKPETTTDLIIVACCLHNLLRDAFLENTNKPHYDVDTTEPPPSANLLPLARAGGFANMDGFSVRDSYLTYFNSPAGSIPWQRNAVTRTH